MGFLSAVKSVGKAVGGAIKDGAEAIGDAANEAADVAEDIGSAGGWFANRACSVDGDVLCGAGSGLGGIWSGGFNIAGGLIRNWGEMADGGLSSIGSIIQGRPRDAFRELAGGLAGLVGTFVTATSAVKQIYDEGKRHWDRNQLRGFVADLIDKEFKDDDRLRSDVRRAVGIDKTDWGLEVQANHRNLIFDSADVNLRALHGTQLNLYELAGHRQAGVGSDQPAAVVYADSPQGDRVSEEEIDDYLNGGSQEIKVAAMHPKHNDRSKRYASKITPDVGIRLSWSDQPHSVQAVSPNGFPILWRGGVDRSDHSDFLQAKNCFADGPKFRDGTIQSECSIEAFGVLFSYEDGKLNRGVASGICGLAATGGCNRTDSCCPFIDSGPNRGTSVAYSWPNNGGARASNRFILAHEIGHWLGLCHKGHDNSSEIMLTLKDNPWYKVGAKALWYGAQHPDFTREDGRNLWMFILQERAGKCFAVQPEPSPVE